MTKTPAPLPDLSTSDLVGAKEAARLLGVNEKMIYRAIHNGSLPAFIPGSKTDGRRSGQQGYKIKAEDLRTWFFGR